MARVPMTTALCWDANDMIAAGTAHNYPQLRCYCHIEGCFQKVSPCRSNNGLMYFRAPGRHVPACPFNSKVTLNATIPQPHRTCPAFEAEDLVPTHLGTPTLVQQMGIPTPEQIADLARNVRHNPPRVFGTLIDVVGAWKEMPSDRKHNTPLYIDDIDAHLNYWTAFCWLGRDRPLPEEPTLADPIFRGTATIRRGKTYYFVDTYVTFQNGTPLNFRIPLVIGKRFDADKLDGPVEFFWRGPLPAIQPQPGTYLIAEQTDHYSGLVILPR